jgi:hypothetical protein
LNFKIKIKDKLKMKENMFFYGPDRGDPLQKNCCRPQSTPMHNSFMKERFEVNQTSSLGALRDYVQGGFLEPPSQVR